MVLDKKQLAKTMRGNDVVCRVFRLFGNVTESQSVRLQTGGTKITDNHRDLPGLWLVIHIRSFLFIYVFCG